MELKDNPLLQPEDFLQGYRDSIENLKNNPELISFDKLCYELFEQNELGKKFMQIAEERYLIPSIVNRESANYKTMVIWADGFKDAFRLIKQGVLSHAQRINAGK
jgi:hypothetical protein